MKLKVKKPIVIAGVAFLLGHGFMSYLGFPIIMHGIYIIAFIGLFIKATSSHNSVFVFRAIVPVVIGLGLISLYRYLYEIPYAKEFLSASIKNDFYLERLFESLAVLYAIITAFLLWKGLNDHDNLRNTLQEERCKIQSLVGFLSYFKSPENLKITNEIREKLKLYVTRMICGETIKTKEENYDLLIELREYVARINVNEQIENIASMEIVRGINDLFQIRMKRITCMESKLSPYILIALSFMSVSLMYVVFTAPPGDTVVMDTIIFILGALLSFMLMMLIDIGSPFEGYWKITTESFHDIVKVLQEEIDTCAKL